MFTITTYHDDRYHPLHGDTYAAADVAAQEAARQTEAAGAQVDVAGAKPESRNKRRKAFFNPDGGAGAAGGGFRV
jgi:hypothetical protein